MKEHKGNATAEGKEEVWNEGSICPFAPGIICHASKSFALLFFSFIIVLKPDGVCDAKQQVFGPCKMYTHYKTQQEADFGQSKLWT